MLHSTDYGELRNGKLHQTSDERKMGHHGSTEELVNRSSSENVEGESPEIQTLTQEAVNEQIRRFIVPLTRQLDDLTQLVQGMSTSRHPNSYPRTELGTTSGTAMPESDMVTGVHRTRHRRRNDISGLRLTLPTYNATRNDRPVWTSPRRHRNLTKENTREQSETTTDASPNVQRDKRQFQWARAPAKQPFATHESQTTGRSETSVLPKSPQRGSKWVLSITSNHNRD